VKITTVGKVVFRAAKQAQHLQEAGSNNPEVAERLKKIRLVDALQKAKRDWKEIKELVGISRSTYYEWKKRLETEGLRGLQPKSRKPRRLRQKVHWTPQLVERIEALRNENPTWGRGLIWFTLRKEGYRVSERTVGRILAYLERMGRIESVASFLARERRGKARRKVKRPHAIRKPKGYEAKEPGALVQVDTLQVVLEGGERVWQFTGVDLVSRYGFGSVHTRATAGLAAEFLEAVVRRSPYPIRAVQVDGGSEFMAEFEETCARLGVKLFVLPPRSPKLNGHVERMQRTLRDEFYTRPLPSGVAAMQEELEGYLAYYNTRRPHMALGGLAPMEYLARLKEGGSQSRMY